MDGLFATTTPRNDASAGVGQWDVRGAYKYVSEAWGGYHFNVNRGLNVDAGIFVSYIGLFSYYNFDNWTYQPSYVSSNTPWFFNGLRIQWFPTKKLKIEPWIINGWQSYNRCNSHHGSWGADSVPSHGMAVDGLQSTMATARIRWVIPRVRASTPTTALKSDTTTTRRATNRQDGVLPYGRFGLRVRGRGELHRQGATKAGLPRVGWAYDRIWWGRTSMPLPMAAAR